MTVKYQTGDIEINVARKWNRDGNLVESYEFVNTGEKDADLQDIAINTPFNDNYPDADLLRSPLQCTYMGRRK